MLTESRYQAQRRGFIRKLEAAKQAHGEAALAESPDVNAKHAEIANVQRDLDSLEAAWEAGAADRERAGKRNAAAVARKRALAGFTRCDTALRVIEEEVPELDKLAAEVGSRVARIVGARSEYFSGLYSMKAKVPNEVTLTSADLIEVTSIKRLFESVLDAASGYQVHPDNAISNTSLAGIAIARGAALTVSGVEDERKPTPWPEGKIPSRARDPRIIEVNRPIELDENGFPNLPGMRFLPQPRGHSFALPSREISRMNVRNDDDNIAPDYDPLA